MWLICGLGNPGNKYKNTRHNIGFDLCDSIINKYEFDLKNKDSAKEIYTGIISNNKCLLCKPLGFMNLSGSAVSKILNFYKIQLDKTIIIHDDLDLKIGKVKIKVGGGNAGHNGLSSIDRLIGKNYKRLRIGISHPGSKELVSSYVLKKFNKLDRKIIDNIIEILTNNFKLIFDNESLLLTKLSIQINK